MLQQSVEQSGTTPDAGPLDVQLAVAVDDATGCPLRDRELESVRQSVSRSGLGDSATCQVAVADADEGGYERTTVGDTCPCLVFDDHDCISDVECVNDGRLLFSAVIPSRDVLRAVVADLRALGANVSVERIRVGTGEADAATDCVELTEKQREVLALAIDAGYYDQPRETALTELADELDVTPSAVSQRLKAVERKLIWERAREFDLQ